MAEFRSIKVKSSLGDPDGVEVTLALGSFTKVVLSRGVGNGSEVVHNITSGDISKMVEEEQRKTFSEREAPDCIVEIDDGQGNTFKFSGFVQGAGGQVGGGEAGASISAIHRAALMAGYRPDIYQVHEVTRGDQDTSPSSVTGGSVFGRLAAIIDRKVTAWSSDERIYSGIARVDAIHDEIDTVNAITGPVALELLEASEPFTRYELFEALQRFEGANNALNQSLINFLDTRSGNFFTTLKAIGAEFKMLYAPSLDDSVGVFKKVSAIFGARESKSCLLVEQSAAIDSASVLPVGKIVVYGLISSEVRPKTGASDQPPGLMPDIVAEFPEGPLQGGTCEAVQAPNFVKLPARGPWTSTGDELDFDAASGEDDSMAEEIAEFVDATAQAFGREWAKQAYIDMALASSSCVLTTDLNLSWQPGVFYEVEAKSSGDGSTMLFWGLLQTAQHTVRRSNKVGVCKTVLTFSHVLAGDLLIPGLEE